MSSSPTSSTRKFWLWAIVALVGGGVAVAWAWAAVNQLPPYRLASLLAPHDKVLRAKADLEEGSVVPAVTEAAAAYQADRSQTNLRLLTCAQVLAKSAGSSEAAGSVSRLDTSNLALAQELYALGLLRSSQRVLDSVTTQSTDRWVLATDLALARKDYALAQHDATAALKLDPTNLTSRRLLVKALQAQKLATTDQDQLITRLTSGRP